MNENRTINLVEVPIGGKSGLIWNRLHGEREDICKALLNQAGKHFEACQQTLQARLRKVDDALDRLMSGSYGNCSKCGSAIDETRLNIDPALALCIDCWSREPGADASNEQAPTELVFESLNRFDTILVRTYNSDYRIMLLDPKIGRALVEGGEYLLEPNDALLKGSAAMGGPLKPGAICVGCRLEMWINERVFLTSPVTSMHVQPNGESESVREISAALH